MRNDLQRLSDIIEAIEQIERKIPSEKEIFYDDEMIQVWIIHHLQIIGEAVRSMSPDFLLAHSNIP